MPQWAFGTSPPPRLQGQVYYDQYGNPIPYNPVQQAPMPQQPQFATPPQTSQVPNYSSAKDLTNTVSPQSQGGLQQAANFATMVPPMDPVTAGINVGGQVLSAGLSAFGGGDDQTGLQEEQERQLHKQTDYNYPKGYSTSEWSNPYATQLQAAGQFAGGQTDNGTLRKATGAASPATTQGLGMQVVSNRLKSIVFMQNLAKIAPLIGLISAGMMTKPGLTAGLGAAALGGAAFARSQGEGFPRLEEARNKIRG